MFGIDVFFSFDFFWLFGGWGLGFWFVGVEGGVRQFPIPKRQQTCQEVFR